MKRCWSIALLTTLAAIAGCAASSPATSASTTTTTTTSSGFSSTTSTEPIPSFPIISTAPDTTDLTQLPVGDYKYTTAPKVGYIFTCSQTFTGGGASVAGPWIKSNGTFDFTAKTVVAGSVPWTAHNYTITLSGTTRTVATNDLPNHNTGTFPIASSDPTYAYDQNPNSIAAQTLSYSLPAIPAAATTETCLPNGIVGFMLTGAVIFNGLDAGGRDAVAHEGQDLCQGHPAPGSTYHYHSLTSCISDPGTAHSNLLGYALDGFGVFGSRGSDGSQLTDADLDECHGHTHAITWDGTTVTMYHYHATREYPYTIGCFHGTAVKANYVAGNAPAN